MARTLESVIKGSLKGYVLPPSLNSATSRVARAVKAYLRSRVRR